MEPNAKRPADESGRPSRAEVLREVERIRLKHGLGEPGPSEEELEDQARYIARRLGETYSTIHRELAPRLLSPEEIEELIAELGEHERFVVEEVFAEEEPDDVA